MKITPVIRNKLGYLGLRGGERHSGEAMDNTTTVTNFICIAINRKLLKNCKSIGYVRVSLTELKFFSLGGPEKKADNSIRVSAS